MKTGCGSAMRDHSACMRRLYADIYQSAEMYSFIYGTRPQSFYEGQILRCYTPEAISSLAPVPEQNKIVIPKPVLREEDHLYRSGIQIEKKNRQVCGVSFGRTGPGEAC